MRSGGERMRWKLSIPAASSIPLPTAPFGFASVNATVPVAFFNELGLEACDFPTG